MSKLRGPKGPLLIGRQCNRNYHQEISILMKGKSNYTPLHNLYYPLHVKLERYFGYITIHPIRISIIADLEKGRYHDRIQDR